MSRIGNHRVEVQETSAYCCGWKSAEAGYPRPTVQPLTAWPSDDFEACCLGWDDYHNQERAA